MARLVPGMAHRIPEERPAALRGCADPLHAGQMQDVGHTTTPLQGCSLASGRVRDPAAEVAQLKQQIGKSMLIWGSLSLTRPLIKAGLVDELHLVPCVSEVPRVRDRARPVQGLHGGQSIQPADEQLGQVIGAGACGTRSLNAEDAGRYVGDDAHGQWLRQRGGGTCASPTRRVWCSHHGSCLGEECEREEVKCRLARGPAGLLRLRRCFDK